MLFVVQGSKAHRVRPGLEILRSVSVGGRGNTRTFKVRFEGPTARPTYVYDGSLVLGCHLAVVEADSPEEAVRQVREGDATYYSWGGFMNRPEGWYPVKLPPKGGSFPRGDEPVIPQ